MSGGVLVVVDAPGGAPDRLSLEALTFARGVKVPVEAVLFGPGSVEKLGAFGVSTVHVSEDKRLAGPVPEARAAAIVQLIDRVSPSAVVAAGSEQGNELLAYVAARLGQPMAANVVAAEPDGGGRLRLTRQRWAGSLLEDAWLDGSPKLLTVAPHAVAAEPASKATSPAISAFAPSLSDRDFRVRVRPVEAAATSGISLSDARVVVGGGRGVGSGEAFSELEDLASLLGAAVGGSRVVTSAGWRPHSDQIGQTGLRIAPDLYIACGISGAIQHIVGCKAAKRILAINTDPDAPIMDVADYAVIGDLHAVVPAIAAELRRRGVGAV
jgi:electron transfer flavoprotein alpha subunit